MKARYNKNTMIKAVAALALAAGGALAAVWLTGGFDIRLAVVSYRLQSQKVTRTVRLAVVTDLHGSYYGEGQAQLVDAIAAAAPDAVLYVGDLLDDKFPHDHSLTLLAALQGKYPAWYVTGNHEHWSGEAERYKELVRGYGVTVLEGESAVVELNGQRVAICGVDDLAAGGKAAFAAQLAAAVPQDNGLFSVLLSHRPERIEQYLLHGFDLVLSGHAHGGQWRLPGLLENGLLAPNQGMLPRYTGGMQQYGTTSHVISRGLALESTPIIPRIYNPPELVVVDIVP